MAIEATVLVPTHNHGELLRRSVTSALRQSVSELEVLIVGDGTDDRTREVALSLCAEDDRVVFFDNPKGPRHGEVHRHRALQDASGRIVCYLGDDDLWLSEHVESMSQLLHEADFCHALAVGIRPNGQVESWVGHLDIDGSRQDLINYKNFIPLSCGAHTMDLYRSLPEGWRTTPEGIHTDVYMWSQILSQSGIIAKTSDRATVLNFPSPWRAELSIDERVRELDEWGEAAKSHTVELQLSRALMDYMARERAAFAQEANGLQRSLDGSRREVEGLRSQLQQIQEALTNSEADHRSLKDAVEDLTGHLNEAIHQRDEAISGVTNATQLLEECQGALRDARWSIDWMENSVTWRIRTALLATPALGSAIRKVGEVRSRAGGH